MFENFLVFYSFLEGTPFAGGFFKIKIVLTKEFPQQPPKVKYDLYMHVANVKIQKKVVFFSTMFK